MRSACSWCVLGSLFFHIACSEGGGGEERAPEPTRKETKLKLINHTNAIIAWIEMSSGSDIDNSEHQNTLWHEHTEVNLAPEDGYDWGVIYWDETYAFRYQLVDIATGEGVPGTPFKQGLQLTASLNECTRCAFQGFDTTLFFLCKEPECECCRCDPRKETFTRHFIVENRTDNVISAIDIRYCQEGQSGWFDHRTTDLYPGGMLDWGWMMTDVCHELRYWFLDAEKQPIGPIPYGPIKLCNPPEQCAFCVRNIGEVFIIEIHPQGCKPPQ